MKFSEQSWYDYVDGEHSDNTDIMYTNHVSRGTTDYLQPYDHRATDLRTCSDLILERSAEGIRVLCGYKCLSFDLNTSVDPILTAVNKNFRKK